MMRRLCLIFVFLLGGVAASAASAAEVMPPAPSAYVNDYAGVMSNTSSLNNELEQFERDTSNQIVVAVYPKMQSDSSMEDYTVRIANRWKVGQQKHKNGAILFVFVQDHKVRIEVGYGLEPSLTDAQSAMIIEQEIKPRFRAGDYTGGITAAVHQMMAAMRGEYKGNGQTANDRNGGGGGDGGGGVSIFVILIIVLIVISFIRRATTYGGNGRRSGSYFGPGFWTGFILNSLMNSGRNSGGGYGGFGGGGSGGGGGGFSGGGGSFGGGGASGSW